MKICSICKKGYKDYGQRCSFCRSCKRKYDREFHKNRSKETKRRKCELQKKRIMENRRRLHKYYLENSCSICGESRVACLQLHHKKPEDKEFVIANNMQKSWDNLKKEIDKCEVLCANCHAIETAKQGNFYNFGD